MPIVIIAPTMQLCRRAKTMFAEKHTQNEPILSVQDLTKIYGREYSFLNKKIGRKVVGADLVTFNVIKGEIFGFLGPNGAGKTTTIRSILGYLNIQSGSISIFGKNHKSDALAIRKNISYVPGDVSLYGNFTGNELIEFFGKFRPINKEFLAELKQNFRVDLTLKIKSLSKGNRQQVALIAALAPKPDFLILDEPSIGLDPLMVKKFHTILKGLKKQGITIFLSSHDLSEVQQICDRVGIIKEGKMIVIEKVEDLQTKSLQLAVVDFGDNGKPSINELQNLESVISVEQINGSSFSVKLREDLNDFLKFLTSYKVKRLTIENSSLQDIFLQYYT